MKRKLTLDVDTLAVKSFETDETTVSLRGTVQGNAKEGPGCPWSQPLSCPGTLHTCTV